MKDQYFYGLCEVSSQLNPGNDKGLKDEYIGYFAHLLHAKTMRVWLRSGELFKVNEGDKLEFKPQGMINLHNYLATLKRNGVERFSLLNWAFIYPYGYKATDGFVVPDPEKEKDMYVRFMKLQAKMYYEIARNFTEIEYFEPTNEPDGESGQFLHKNGYSFSFTNNEDKVYSRSEIEHIVLDLCYFASLGVKEANKEGNVLFPGFCNLPSATEYLDNIYNLIASNQVPTIGTKSTNIEDFFQILSWHPYNLKDSDINSYWVSTQYALFDIMKKNGDGNRKVWYTEIGWSDFKREDEANNVAKRFIDFLNITSKEFPNVETVLFFRLFTLANKVECEGEDNFGLVFNEHDWNNSLLPKPAIVALYQYINGDDADLSPLYKYALSRSKAIFPFESSSFREGYKVLYLGNYITYQNPAIRNEWKEGRGLGSSCYTSDYVYLVNNYLKNIKGEISFTRVNAKAYEKTFYSNEILSKLSKFKEMNPDLVIINLGDCFGGCSLVDHDIVYYFDLLIKEFKTNNTKVLVTNTLSNYNDVNEKLKLACSQNNIEIVDISHIRNENRSLFNKKYLNDEYSVIPSDIGHSLIAESIIKKLKEMNI